MFQKLIYISFIAVVFISGACTNENIDLEPEDSFLKVFDDKGFNESYIPLDVHQTDDGSYLILSGKRISESNFTGIQVIRVNEQGDFLGTEEFPSALVHPVGGFIRVEDSYKVFCMNSTSLQVHIVDVSAQGRIIRTTELTGLFYPLAVVQDNNRILLHSYDNFDKRSVVSILSPEGGITQRHSFSIGPGEDVERPIIEHFNRTGKQLPFQVGAAPGGLIYFNGFYRHTFSLVFTNMSGDEPAGVVQGQQHRGGLSSILHIEDNRYAVSRFNFGDNTYMPSVQINPRGITSSIDFPGNSIPELKPDAKVVLKTVNIKGEELLLYGSDTKQGQIVLLAYDKSSGTLKGSKYLGFSFPYEIASFHQTSDGGLAIVALTHVAGRFPRVCLFKLAKSELEEIIFI